MDHLVLLSYIALVGLTILICNYRTKRKVKENKDKCMHNILVMTIEKNDSILSNNNIEVPVVRTEEVVRCKNCHLIINRKCIGLHIKVNNRTK